MLGILHASGGEYHLMKPFPINRTGYVLYERVNSTSVHNSTFQEDDKKKVSVPVEEAVAKKRRTRTNE